MKDLILLSIAIAGLCSCQTRTIQMTDKYEDHALISVPSHVEAIEVNGRRVSWTFPADNILIEIPVGRTEFVFRFYRIYMTQHDDDHEKVYSDKQTAVFIAEKNNHYEVKMPNPDDVDEAVSQLKEMKAHILHKESGMRIDAVQGIIEERFHGVKTVKPYQELKYWWKKSTQKEKDNFMKWARDQ